MKYICQNCGNLVDVPFARDGDGYYCSQECVEENWTPEEQEEPLTQTVEKHEDYATSNAPLPEEIKHDFYGNEKKPKEKRRLSSVRVAYYVVLGFLALIFGWVVIEKIFFT